VVNMTVISSERPREADDSKPVAGGHRRGGPFHPFGNGAGHRRPGR
jgi:hypothetical protein